MSNVNVDVGKEAWPPTLESVSITLEWRDGGIFNNIYPRKRIDLDVGVIALSKDNAIVELISYNNLNSKNGSIIHHGDNIHSSTKTNRENINIDLTNVDAKVHTLMIAVHSFNGDDIAETRAARLILSGNNSSDNIIFNLADYQNSTGIIIGAIRRTEDNRKWRFVAVGVNAEGQTMNQLASTAIMYSQEIPDTIII